MDADVVEMRAIPYERILGDITHLTVRAPAGICRECGRDIPGSHESMKCSACRTHNEEWDDAALY